MSLRPYFATPMYHGQAHWAYQKSLMRTVEGLRGIGIPCGVPEFPIYDSLLPRGRGRLCAMFLQATSCDVLFFIDADIEFDPTSVLHILNIMEAFPEMEVIGAGCPLKGDPLTFNVNFPGETGEQIPQHAETGCLEALEIGTAFVAIRRSAIEKMIGAYPSRKCCLHVGAPYQEQEFHYDFFPVGPEAMISSEARGIDGIGSIYLSEDFGFCSLWRQIGGKVWVSPEITLSHWDGMRPYKGKLKDYMVSDEAWRGNPA